MRSDDSRWGTGARFFHWLMALAILGNGIFGLWMTSLAPSLAKINIFALHKSIGLTVLALFLLRLAWRMGDRRPPDEPAPAWQRLAAHVTHGLLYVLIVAIPVSGWVFNSAHGYPLQWFKLFNLPPLVAKDDQLMHVAVLVHEYLFYALLLVLVAHVGAALWHHFILRDNVLRRMLPFGRPRKVPPSGDPS
nr:cytochrome b [Pinirhizobacter soli]